MKKKIMAIVRIRKIIHESTVTLKKRGKEREKEKEVGAYVMGLFFTKECQPKNIEGMTKLENHYLSTPKLIINSGKDKQSILKCWVKAVPYIS